jgi:hypothetical protein
LRKLVHNRRNEGNGRDIGSDLSPPAGRDLLKAMDLSDYASYMTGSHLIEAGRRPALGAVSAGRDKTCYD